MGRLDPELLERFERFSDRAVTVGEHLEKQGRSKRIVDQIMASGSSVGANLFEADEGMSRKDFCKSIAIAIKELNETRFWLRLLSRRNWIESSQLGPLLKEAEELKRILGAILSRTRAADIRKSDM